MCPLFWVLQWRGFYTNNFPPSSSVGHPHGLICLRSCRSIPVDDLPAARTGSLCKQAGMAWQELQISYRASFGTLPEWQIYTKSNCQPSTCSRRFFRIHHEPSLPVVEQTEQILVMSLVHASDSEQARGGAANRQGATSCKRTQLETVICSSVRSSAHKHRVVRAFRREEAPLLKWLVGWLLFKV